MQISKDFSLGCKLPQSASGRNSSSADTSSPLSFQKVLGKSIHEAMDTDNQRPQTVAGEKTEGVPGDKSEDAQVGISKPRPAVQEEESTVEEAGQALLMAMVPVAPEVISEQTEPAEDPLVSLQTAISTVRREDETTRAGSPPAQVEETTLEQEAPENPIVSMELEYEDSDVAYPGQMVVETPREQQTRFEQLVAQASKDLDSRAERSAPTQNILETVENEQWDDEKQDRVNPVQRTAQVLEQTEPQKPDSETMPRIRSYAENVKLERTGQKNTPESESEVVSNVHFTAQQGVRTQSVHTQEMQQPDRVYQVPDQVEQVRAQVVEQLGNQKMEFHMQLNPEELGEVEVKMVLESGRLAVQIIAATPEAAELLSKHVDGLAASLRASSIQLDSVQVVGQTQNAESQMQGAFNMNHSSGSERDPQEQSEGSGEQPAFEDELPTVDQEPDSVLNYEI